MHYLLHWKPQPREDEEVGEDDDDEEDCLIHDLHDLDFERASRVRRRARREEVELKGTNKF